ncbi:hypothetical protein EDD86DRAFT_274849 [Gorgonomyces haynaldii]|nr:hypothetical protein EDD86DRAFT_274849 [Gorgonomyces haynaldii]
MFRLFFRTKTDLTHVPKRTTQASPLLMDPEQLPKNTHTLYQVIRRTSGDLPVYTDYKNGRTRQLTLVRHIMGDKRQLVLDLSQFIPIERIQIKPSQLVINGQYALAVRKYLTLQGH